MNGLDKIKLLIIDDDDNFIEDIRDKLYLKLKENKIDDNLIEFEKCPNFNNAKKIIDKIKFDIVVLDLNLPEGDGLGKVLIRYIKEKSYKTKIITITGELRTNKQDEYMNESYFLGTNEFILKESNTPYADIIVDKIIYFLKLFIKTQILKKEIYKKFLIFDPTEKILKILKKILKEKNNANLYELIKVNSIETAIEKCKKENINGIIVNGDEEDNNKFIEKFLRNRKDIPLIAITEDENIEKLKKLIKKGVNLGLRLINSGCNSKLIESIIDKAIEFRNKRLNNFNLVGKHPSLINAIGEAEVAAKSKAPVFIFGESGTGKELIAESIHKLSGRKGKFITINCAAIPHSLLESELFGHVKGIFTSAISDKEGLFETANEGTLFLDEITEMPVDLQTKLLRVIENMKVRRIGSTEDKKVDVKIIAATNKDVQSLIKKGKFISDLYHRLNVFHITLPPLRERKSDIPILIYHFITKFSEEYKKGVIDIEEKAINFLQNQDWSGSNVRELKNFIERIIAKIPDNKEIITLDDVREELLRYDINNNNNDCISIKIPINLNFKEAEHLTSAILIMEKLKRKDGDRNKVIKELQISNDTFYKSIEKGIKIALNKCNKDIEKALLLLSVDKEDKKIYSFIKRYIMNKKSLLC